MEWFSVDRKGLGNLVAGKSRTMVIAELVSNAWDTNAKNVTVTLKNSGKPGWCDLEILDDDPNGFSQISHAWTLFAQSSRGNDATKRGRFNLGEKLVLALCDWAEILTTTGTVTFDKAGRTYDKKIKSEYGSRFRAVIKMTKPEMEEVSRWIFTVIPPQGCVTKFNGETLPQRAPFHSFELQLPTVLTNEEGELRPTIRKTRVDLHEPLPGEVATIYEMGIPVVESGDAFHVDIQQKVPLNQDRDNVTPSYLRKVRTAVMNETYNVISVDEANSTWSKEAMADPNITPEAVRAVVEKRFGDKVVSYDMSDPEANKIAVAKGYTVVHGRSLSKDEWENIRSSAAILPAGQVTPSPKVTIQGIDMADLDGSQDSTLIPEEKWTEGMNRMVWYAKALAKELLGFDIRVEVRRASIGDRWLAAYGGRRLMFNLTQLGHKFFDEPHQHRTDDLLLHEFSHDKVLDHLDMRFANECTRLGALLRDCKVKLDG